MKNEKFDVMSCRERLFHGEERKGNQIKKERKETKNRGPSCLDQKGQKNAGEILVKSLLKKGKLKKK